MSEEHKHDEHAEGGHSKGHGGGHGGGGHGGGAHEEHEGAPEWLISFADNVALLMGFFVILLAMNMMEPKSGGLGGKEQNGGTPGVTSSDPRVLDMIISIRSAFNNPVSIDSSAPSDAALVKRLKDKKVKPSGKANIDAPAGDKPEVQSVRPSNYKKVGATVAFGDGSASISSDAVAALVDIATRVRGKKWVIEVRGNASAAETFKNTAAGYQLSYERAMAVAEVLSSNGVGWNQIRVVSCGDGDRLVPLAYSSAEHRPNQRAEVVITDDVVPDDPHQRETAEVAP